MLKDKLTLMVHSCNKFSDLWDAHFKLLNENWRDRDLTTYLVTDDETDITFEGVQVICAGIDIGLIKAVGLHHNLHGNTEPCLKLPCVAESVPFILIGN